MRPAVDIQPQVRRVEREQVGTRPRRGEFQPPGAVVCRHHRDPLVPGARRENDESRRHSGFRDRPAAPMTESPGTPVRPDFPPGPFGAASPAPASQRTHWRRNLKSHPARNSAPPAGCPAAASGHRPRAAAAAQWCCRFLARPDADCDRRCPARPAGGRGRRNCRSGPPSPRGSNGWHALPGLPAASTPRRGQRPCSAASVSPVIAATGFSPAGNSPCPTDVSFRAQRRQRHQRHGLAVAPSDIGFRVGERDLERRILDCHGLHQAIGRGVEDKDLVRVRAWRQSPSAHLARWPSRWHPQRRRCVPSAHRAPDRPRRSSSATAT